MFSRRSAWLLLEDVSKYFQNFLTNFWPDKIEISCDFFLFKKNVFLFLWDYFYFREKFLLFIQKLIFFSVYLLFLFLLCFYLKSFEIEIKNTYLFPTYFLIVLFVSLKHKGWPAHFLSYLTFFIALRLLYYYLPISGHFFFFLAFFFFFRKVLLFL